VPAYTSFFQALKNLIILFKKILRIIPNFYNSINGDYFLCNAIPNWTVNLPIDLRLKRLQAITDSLFQHLVPLNLRPIFDPHLVKTKAGAFCDKRRPFSYSTDAKKNHELLALTDPAFPYNLELNVSRGPEVIGNHRCTNSNPNALETTFNRAGRYLLRINFRNCK